MENRDAFSAYHPLVHGLYFALVLLLTMFVLHPASLLISLTSAVLYHASLHGWSAVHRQLRLLLPMLLLAAVINPAFSHAGNTVLAYLSSGNPLTLESILYGVAAAGLLAAVLTWFSCCNAVMNAEEFLYLFGRAAPALSLVLSMTLRLVPRFRTQFRAVSDAQRCVGRDASQGGVLHRLRIAGTVLSILVTWALENAMETAASMKSRGYGLPGRTSFSIYRLERRDRTALAWLGFCGFYMLCGWAAGGLRWQYAPVLGGAPLTPWTVSFQAVYLALCLTPVILDRREARSWRRLPSET